MTLTITTAFPQVTPGGNRDSRTEDPQRDARRRVDDVANARRYGNTGEPNARRNQQCREHVAEPGAKRRVSCLALGQPRCRAMRVIIGTLRTDIRSPLRSC